MPEDFSVDDVCNTALSYLAQAFNGRDNRLECHHDDEYGEKARILNFD
jgi:hypothetical protein